MNVWTECLETNENKIHVVELELNMYLFEASKWKNY